MENQTTVFAAKLREHLESEPRLSRRGEKVLRILKARPSRRRDRQIRRMELHAAAELDTTPGEIDWTNLDWSAVIGQILSILLKLMGGILKL